MGFMEMTHQGKGRSGRDAAAPALEDPRPQHREEGPRESVMCTPLSVKEEEMVTYVGLDALIL